MPICWKMYVVKDFITYHVTKVFYSFSLSNYSFQSVYSFHYSVKWSRKFTEKTRASYFTGVWSVYTFFSVIMKLDTDGNHKKWQGKTFFFISFVWETEVDNYHTDKKKILFFHLIKANQIGLIYFTKR